MKEANWDDCIRKNLARITSPNIERAKSLIETAKERIAVINKTTRRNCNFVFEDYYTSILEFLQAITFKKGFNVLNHLCIGFYLRDILKREDLHLIFNDLRYKRNSLIYYGNRMEYEIAKQAIETCKKFIQEIEFLI